ncbi:cysteine peptidase family C39 domain-containing protein [Erysipelothrix urinaevulpis]|uniref:cysteine peptidase family C39 domain-containing protein n=1 Tax=Erysipelothrix urinaevulpis TaxID=2683717 RepID=UPI001357E197|nr:cysteine peptidase family C39 domain-containing protein [Erysipelothrix urinaevulpis]
MLSKIRLNKYPNVKEHDSSDCAAAVISTILLKYKKEISLMKVRETIESHAYGTSLKGMVEVLEKLKFIVKAIRTSTKYLTGEITLPAIAQVKTKSGLNHFIVLNKITKKNEFIISDPANEVSKVTYEDFDSWFTGFFIVLIPTSEFVESTLRDK